MLKIGELVSVEHMTKAELAALDAETARDMARRGYVGIHLSETVDADFPSVEHRIETFYQTHLAPTFDHAAATMKSLISPVSIPSIPPSISASVHQFFASFVAPVLDRAYDALKPAMVPNLLEPRDVVTLTDEKMAQYHYLVEDRNTLLTAAKFRRSQTPASLLVNFWNGVFSDLKPYNPRAPAPVQSVQPVQSQPVQSIEAPAPLLSLPSLPVPSVDALADQFFNTPEPDYALGAGETLVVQFKPETADKYLTLLEGHATITPIAKDHHVYRLSDVHLTPKGVAELKNAAHFALLVDDHVKARYDTKNDVVHFDTGLRAAFARALVGGRKVTQDHYVVQPYNGSTQKLLDAVQKYELPVHAIDLRNGVFVFDGRYRLSPELLNSGADRTVVSPAVYRSGTRVYDIARRVAEAQKVSPASPN